MASVPASPRSDAPRLVRRAARHRRMRRHGLWAFATIALTLVLLLRLAPAENLLALDRIALTGAPPAPSPSTPPPETPGGTFPGSAYFFAQDAFAPTGIVPDPDGNPAVTNLLPGESSLHVLRIDDSPAAQSMPMRGLTILDQARALQCLTNALYFEAGNEPEEGQRAVAQVILNRLASGRWPDSICGVVYQGTERSDRLCQFTFSCDGSMARIPAAPSWSRARRVATQMLAGAVFAPAGLATFYHTLAVRPPWADRLRPVAVIGAHIFYRLPGEAGAPAAHHGRYSGRETAQPGPYAFTPPPRPMPLLAPPGPDFMPGWPAPPATIPGAPAGVQTAGSTLPYSLAPATNPYALRTHRSRPGAAAPEYRTEAKSPDLPQSAIRPEYRNSGRLLHQNP